MKYRLNYTGASTHPCLTPFEISNLSEDTPSDNISPVMSSWSNQMRVVNFAGHPSFLRITHSTSFLTVLNAFVRENAFLLNLSDCKDHVDCAAATAKSTLGLGEIRLCD